MRLQVPPEAEGERLDVLLAGPLGSRARAQRLIAAGQVLVDGAPAQKRLLVTAGQEVEVDETDNRPAPPAAQGIDVPIAYEDDEVLVVDKPAGLVVHPAPGHWGTTLVELLAGRTAGGEDERPGIVHRLDRETSGLLVVARTEDAHRTLKRELEAREIEREYVTLVEGRPPARTGTIDAPLGRDRRRRTRRSSDSDDTRPAVTHFAIEEELPGFTLLRVHLETGRTHQIRAHMLAIGHPVAGDPEYGTPGQLGLERQFLHARRLSFTHPRTGDPVEVSSPLPDDLAAVLARLRSG
ncbi:RluA family pseudouridine synthase [Svornostia abyssi]|uniref:Pseudouridine synthase n=1 Tax=Svornostia abyssi TaxID=2898438 RepID=A0ABY5PCE0_9ACTN|nr:RluA family pseudouridine synthase [Parviterribacteraceae bacterium J379]